MTGQRCPSGHNPGEKRKLRTVEGVTTRSEGVRAGYVYRAWHVTSEEEEGGFGKWGAGG